MSNNHDNVVVPSYPSMVEKYRTISINIANPSGLDQLDVFSREGILWKSYWTGCTPD